MTRPETSLRLASYNIQKCVGLDLRRLPRRTLQVLDGLGADVVTLQEADKRLPPRPAALPHFVLNEAGWQIADLGGAGSLGWHGNAIIWRDDRIRVLARGHVVLPGLEPRGAVWVDLETVLGALRFVGMHLGLIGQYRRQQVLHLVQELSDLPPRPTAWAGDFNDWSFQSHIDHCAPQMRFLPPAASFPSPRPVAPLDRIALGPGLRAARHGVHNARPAHIASDHLPVWADLVAVT